MLLGAVVMGSSGGWCGERSRLAAGWSSSTIGQVAKHACQCEFRISRLEAVVERRRDQPLGRRLTHSLGEEIGVATKVRDGRPYR
jgi:hypothetical protein